MKTILKALAIAAVGAPAFIAVPASAQAVQGLAFADLDRAVQTTNAYKAAVEQMKVTYKAQIDAVNAKGSALEAELKPLADKFNADRAAKKDEATLRAELTAIQSKQQAGEAEMQRLNQPVALADAYVREQIVGKLEAAVRSAMTKKKVSVLMKPDAAVLFQPTADITADVVTELNATVPSVQVTPPAGWQPGRAGQAAPAATPAPAKPQPSGR